ncbi:serine dehydratase subunit alpha family protein [Flammeovirga sp. MY04]|uniref:L-cysteine desulfidase family protein n=1 Tax=Flammeovirga sp. MY04 TaxID=1191459 RepID=UPI0008270DDF|nr:L-serine ammonia-lyase, iron-sulfur-dependent, subunit alpha [Flammeovirga sp. MY04]ANQ51388.2 serine dehydratase subunit alpha family protein [Flammeovirga sp. MY04]
MSVNKEEEMLFLKIMEEEIVPAEGCTEPIAIAYAAALATKYLGEKPQKLVINVSGNILKNAMSVVVPNSEGKVGIKVAAAMGALFGDAEADLMVISNVNADDMEIVTHFLQNNTVEINVAENAMALYINMEVEGNNHNASVEIKHTHTNVTKVIKDGKTLIDQPCNDSDFNSSLTDRSILSVEKIFHYANIIDIEKIAPVFSKVVDYNKRIAEEGLNQKYGVNIGAAIQKNISRGIYGDDQRNRSASFTAAGSDARMGGSAMPVMTTSGSGNQGMTASLPIIRYCLDQGISDEKLYRALFMSHLTTVHVKTNVGRLSAYCGAMTASAAVSGTLVYLEGGNVKDIQNAITNTLGNVSGVICDGAKASCATKIASGIYSAFDGAMLAQMGSVLSCDDGIIGDGVEDTIQNVGTLAQEGMKTTDKTILEIMTK